MTMENKMTPEEEEFALAEATKARQYLEHFHQYQDGICLICKKKLPISNSILRYLWEH